VLFLTDDSAQPFEYQPIEDKRSLLNECYFDQLSLAEDVLSSAERRLLLTFYLLSLFIKSLLPTRPILALIGSKGSGKSNALRRLGMLLFGENFNLSPLGKDERDFDAAATNSYLLARDNVDTQSVWLNDRLAVISTGGTIQLRQLYSTNKLVEVRPDCFLALTSRTPSFKRDDVAERLLIFPLEIPDKRRSERELLQEILDNRNRLMSELLSILQQVLISLEATKNSRFEIQFRMADFAESCLRIASQHGLTEMVQNIFAKMSREQSNFTLDDDPLFELFSMWLRIKGNQDREVTNSVLCEELAILADQRNIKFEFHSRVRSFAQTMNTLRASMQHVVEVTERRAGGNKRLYAFRFKRQ